MRQFRPQSAVLSWMYQQKSPPCWTTAKGWSTCAQSNWWRFFICFIWQSAIVKRLNSNSLYRDAYHQMFMLQIKEQIQILNGNNNFFKNEIDPGRKFSRKRLREGHCVTLRSLGNIKRILNPICNRQPVVCILYRPFSSIQNSCSGSTG